MDLALEDLDLFLLGFATLVVLVYGAELEHILPLGLLVLFLQLLLLAFVIVKGVPLCDSLLSELLVLQVDVLLYVQDVSLCIPLCLLLKQVELSLCLPLQPLLLLGQLYLVVVFLLLYDLLEVLALGPPVEELGLELHPLLVGLVHNVTVFLQLTQLHLVLLDFLIAFPLDILDLRLEARDYLIVVPLVLLLQLCDLTLQADGLLQLLVILLL